MTEPLRPEAPHPVDFLGIDDLLSGEERLLRDTVREFVTDKVKPYIAEWFEDATFPRELVREMGDLGLLGMHLDGYNCAGTSAVAYGLACTELEAGDSGVRSFVSVQGSLAMYPNGGRRDHWLFRFDRTRLRIGPGIDAYLWKA